ncbi:aldo/keto reductase, partial [Campylobacter coli]|nr:aldo/keto reductase [Campylobacter coli]
IFNHPLLLCMAKKYSKTPAQIILNFLYKLGILLIPKSSNLQIFDFELEDEDTQKLIYLDQNKSFFGWYD